MNAGRSSRGVDRSRDIGRGSCTGRGRGASLGIGRPAFKQVAFPFGQRFRRTEHTVAGRLLLGAGPASPRDQAIRDGVGHDPGEQGDAADRVVVARNWVVDLIGIAVGVQDRDHRDAELARFADRDVLLLGVHHPDGAGNPGHVPDPPQRALQLVPLAPELKQFLLRHVRARHVVEVEFLEFLQALQPLVDGGKVRQHAAQPALVDERHTHPTGLLSDRLLRLLLGADVQHRAAVRDRLLDELVSTVDE